MKTIKLVIIGFSIVLSVNVFAGLVQPAEVDVDLVNRTALGDMWTARTADNDVDFIGCGIRHIQPDISFGFCQAQDADDEMIICFTEDPFLLDALDMIGDFSFVTFSWNELEECTRIGVSTQSFYLPNFKTKKGSKGSKGSK